MTKKQLNNKKYRETHKKQIAIAKKSWYEKNKFLVAQKKKIKYDLNKDTTNAKKRLKNAQNPEIRASLRKKYVYQTAVYNKAYRKENPGIVKALKAKRRAAKLMRTPKWLTSLDWEKIEEYYQYASLLSEVTGIPYQVDHIIPLQGKEISGLHCPENLQLLTKEENNKKKNKFPYNKDR
jgi:5-methylcytosine-specific restriction endonuclease McrA